MSALAVAIGMRVKTGRATALVMAGTRAAPRLLERRELQLHDPKVPYSGQPHHAALELDEKKAAPITRRALETVRALGRSELEAAIRAVAAAGHELRGLGLVVGSLGDPAKLGNPHVRAHALEGRLYWEVLADAARELDTPCAVIAERDLYDARGEGARPQARRAARGARGARQSRRPAVGRGGEVRSARRVERARLGEELRRAPVVPGVSRARAHRAASAARRGRGAARLRRNPPRPSRRRALALYKSCTSGRRYGQPSVAARTNASIGSRTRGSRRNVHSPPLRRVEQELEAECLLAGAPTPDAVGLGRRALARAAARAARPRARRSAASRRARRTPRTARRAECRRRCRHAAASGGPRRARARRRPRSTTARGCDESSARSSASGSGRHRARRASTTRA